MSTSPSNPTTPSDRPKRKWRRWLARGIAAMLVVVVAALWALPHWLSSNSGRRWLLTQANRVMAPGRIDADGFAFSWWGSTRITGFALFDPRQKRVLHADTLVWDRNLWRLLTDRPRYGSFYFGEAKFDIARGDDGAIDLVEALQSILSATPATDWSMHFDSATLLLKTPELAEPLRADRFDLVLNRPAAPGPISWNARLESDAPSGSIEIAGDVSLWTSKHANAPDLRVEFRAASWPLFARIQELSLLAKLSGAASVSRTNSDWKARVYAQPEALELSGRALGGDRFGLERAALKVDASQSDQRWTVETLNIDAPGIQLTASGPIPALADPPTKVHGSIDLAAIARQLPHALQLPEGVVIERGDATIDITATTDQAKAQSVFEGTGGLGNLVVKQAGKEFRVEKPARFEARAVSNGDATLFGGKLTLDAVPGLEQAPWAIGPVELAADGAHLQKERRVEMKSLTLNTSKVVITGAGQIADQAGRWAIDLKGSVRPDWSAIESWLREKVGPEASVAGKSGSFEITGPLAYGIDEIDASIGLDVAGFRAYGLELGPLPIVARLHKGVLALDQIDTSLNGGRLWLKPHLQREADGPYTVRLEPGRAIENAEVNDEMSARVLSFINPIFSDATRVRGKVSAAIDKAEFPLGEGARNKAVVEGMFVFHQVEFLPGPMSAELLSMINRENATLRLDQPVVVAIHDGAVYQKGLAIPIGEITKLGVEGAVGFDKSLDVAITLPLTARLFGKQDILANVVDVPTVKIPLTGTLDDPKFDTAAFADAMAEMGQNLLMRGLLRGLPDFLGQLGRIRANAGPPQPRMTPAERKAMQQEKKAERKERQLEKRMKRGMP